MRKIKLTRGEYALVDNEDYAEISKHKWFCKLNKKSPDTKYAVGAVRIDGVVKNTHMTRLILKVPKGMVVDHINHNGLDNRRKNLRICTPQQNTWNRRITSKKKSRGAYKGVIKYSNGYYAKIHSKGKTISLGLFQDPKEAAKLYDIHARKLFGEFAHTNFPITKLSVTKK